MAQKNTKICSIFNVRSLSVCQNSMTCIEYSGWQEHNYEVCQVAIWKKGKIISISLFIIQNRLFVSINIKKSILLSFACYFQCVSFRVRQTHRKIRRHQQIWWIYVVAFEKRTKKGAPKQLFPLKVWSLFYYLFTFLCIFKTHIIRFQSETPTLKYLYRV